MYHNGFHGDLNETFLIGNVSDVSKKLTKVTWECLERAIQAGKSKYVKNHQPFMMGLDLKYMNVIFSETRREV